MHEPVIVDDDADPPRLSPDNVGWAADAEGTKTPSPTTAKHKTRRAVLPIGASPVASLPSCPPGTAPGR